MSSKYCDLGKKKNVQFTIFSVKWSLNKISNNTTTDEVNIDAGLMRTGRLTSLYMLQHLYKIVQWA